MAGIANWSMLAGFMIFPSSFDNSESNFKIGASSLRVVAVCLLVFGYILTGLLCWRFENLLFQIEAIFLYGTRTLTLLTTKADSLEQPWVHNFDNWVYEFTVQHIRKSTSGSVVFISDCCYCS